MGELVLLASELCFQKQVYQVQQQHNSNCSLYILFLCNYPPTRLTQHRNFDSFEANTHLTPSLIRLKLRVFIFILLNQIFIGYLWHSRISTCNTVNNLNMCVVSNGLINRFHVGIILSLMPDIVQR